MRSLVVVVLFAIAVVPLFTRAADPGITCTNSKGKAAAKKAGAKLTCVSKAYGKPTPVDPLCLGTAESKFSTAFTKAEGKGGCPTTNDTGSVEGLVDSCVGAIRNLDGAANDPSGR